MNTLKTLALTMLLTNMYGMMHETPGSSVGSDGSNVSTSSAQPAQESSTIAEHSHVEDTAKAARIKEIKDKLRADCARWKKNSEDRTRDWAADAEKDKPMREYYLQLCKEHGVDPKKLEREFDERVQARIEAAARAGTLKHVAYIHQTLQSKTHS